MRVRRMIAVGCVAALGAVAAGLAVPAGAGESPHVLNIEKVVVGDLPPGTEFIVHVVCVDDSQNGFLGVDEELPFTGPGSESVEVLLSGAELPVTCTVTETDDGGAATVAYACEDDFGASECVDDNVIELFEPGESTITVTNTFEAEPEPEPAPEPLEPPAAAPVAGAPRFTG